MPTIEVSKKDLEKLAGRKLSKLDEELELAKAELESKRGDVLKLDIKDTNRPDLWSVEGIARQLSKSKGCPTYKVKKGNYKLNVSKKVAKVRPRIAAAVVKNIKVTNDLIRELIQLQEKVTNKTKNLMIEVTGYDDKFVQASLNVLACALADRGGKIESVTIDYKNKKIVTPNLAPKKSKVKIESIQKIAGEKLNAIKLLEKARYNAKKSGKVINVEYPAYRQDILHEVDIIEDILIAYGYNKFKPEVPKLAVTGEEAEIEKLSRKVREVMVGFGAQEIATFTLTNKDNQFKKMNLPWDRVAEIENPVSKNWSCLRKWLLPSLLEFLSKNTTKEFPQRIFEVGDVIHLNPKAETRTDTVRKLAFAFSNLNVTFTQAKQTLQALGTCLGIKFNVRETELDSFISGRVGKIYLKGKEIGLIGEIHPQVLANFGLTTPVVAFEIDLSVS